MVPSTVSTVLHRHGLIDVGVEYRQAWQRFEYELPNALWQADFKGYFETLSGRCMPLTVLDDHSRFNLVLHACDNARAETVRECLETAFRRYGMPVRMNFDNGAPWGCPSQPGQVTSLELWLVRLGIRISHSRPYHPQTNGKDERFHRTLKAEVLNGRSFNSLNQVQTAFDDWRSVYNHERPHEAIALDTPVSRYRPSPRGFPSRLPEIEYGPDDAVVTVKWNGELRYKGKRFKVSSALHRHEVAKFALAMMRMASMMCFMRTIIAKPSTLHTHEKHINVSTMSSYMCHLCPRSIQDKHKKERSPKGEKRILRFDKPNTYDLGRRSSKTPQTKLNTSNNSALNTINANCGA